MAYLDNDTDFTIHSSGVVLLGSVGHKLEEGELNGTAEYSIKTNVWNQYNMDGVVGTLYVFAVKGKINPYSLLPGEQKDIISYKTSSNVLQSNFIFK